MFEKEYIKFEILYKKCDDYISKKFWNFYKWEVYFAMRQNWLIENYTYLPLNNVTLNIFFKKTIYKYIKNNIVYNKDFLDKIFFYINNDDKYYTAFWFDKNKGRIKLYVQFFDKTFLQFLYNIWVSKDYLNIDTGTIWFDFYIYEDKFDIKFYNKIETKIPPELIYLKDEILFGPSYEITSFNWRSKIELSTDTMPTMLNASEIIKKIFWIDYEIKNVHLSYIWIENWKIYSLYFMENK